MDREPAGLDFAVLGHVQSWERASDLVHAFRSSQLPRLDAACLQDLFSWIPPRTLASLQVESQIPGLGVRGEYIETFIRPDQLCPEHLRHNLERVRRAAEVALLRGAKIVGLGGFTSIVCEGRLRLPRQTQRRPEPVFTTGNSLTAAFLVKGVEAALRRRSRDLSDCSLLLVGATGDIGQGCADYFGDKVRRLLLHARNRSRLARQHRDLVLRGIPARVVENLQAGLPAADVVVCVASMSRPEVALERCRRDAIVCDAGHPRNVRPGPAERPPRLFLGGMGRVGGGLEVQPEIRGGMGCFPLPAIAHGCLMEPALLALEGRCEPFSQGRGNITAQRIEEIWALAKKHGFELAPPFNDFGVWPD